MATYKLVCTAFKTSGERFSEGRSILLGSHERYPTQVIFETLKGIGLNLDKVCGLEKGSVESNNLTVLAQVLDSNTNEICFQCLI